MDFGNGSNSHLKPQQKESIVVSCPECHSTRVWKDGFRKAQSGTVQRYLCRNCEYRFSEYASRESGHKDNIPHHSTSACRVRVSEREAKNLAAEQPINVESAGATEQTGNTVTETIIQFKWSLFKNGYAEVTITSQAKLLKILQDRGANLFKPDSVKDIIAKQRWSSGRKVNAVNAYTNLLTYHGMSWNPPRYQRIDKLPFIPTEHEVNQLISGCGQKISVFLKILKETAIRRGEAFQLRWSDIDFKTQTLRVTPEKGSNPRIFKLTTELIAMLNHLPRHPEHIFGTGNVLDLQRTFQRQRKRIAFKLGNSRIQRITFHTLRHWKATMLYHQTKDVLYVKQFLGHKDINNTLKYIQLENALFTHQDDQYICKVARTIDEAKAFIEQGFEYICDFNDAKVFRKRK
jgi:integrase